jgi:hypothetical protein
VVKIIEMLKTRYNTYFELETSSWNNSKDESCSFTGLNTGFDYTMHFDLIEYMFRWCECEDETECKLILQEVSQEKEVFLGEFVKAILKINNITCELEKVAELIGDIEFLHKLKDVHNKTLKYVATNQSLYV